MDDRDNAIAYLEIAEKIDSDHKYTVECSLIGIGYALLALEQTLREVGDREPE